MAVNVLLLRYLAPLACPPRAVSSTGRCNAILSQGVPAELAIHLIQLSTESPQMNGQPRSGLLLQIQALYHA